MWTFFHSQAFSEGAASSFDYTLKEKAPFTIQNALGLPLLIQHSSNLRIVDKPGPGKLHEVNVDQSIDLSYSVIKPLTRAHLSPLQRPESCPLLSMGKSVHGQECAKVCSWPLGGAFHSHLMRIMLSVYVPDYAMANFDLQNLMISDNIDQG